MNNITLKLSVMCMYVCMCVHLIRTLIAKNIANRSQHTQPDTYALYYCYHNHNHTSHHMHTQLQLHIFLLAGIILMYAFVALLTCLHGRKIEDTLAMT
jgi:hypothetical protein